MVSQDLLRVQALSHCIPNCLLSGLLPSGLSLCLETTRRLRPVEIPFEPWDP